MELRPGAVVVGVDGSPEARVAARLGAQEARHRGAPLELVLVLPWREPARQRATGADLAGVVRSAAGLILEATAAHAGRAAPGIAVATHVVTGHPAQVLLEASSTAALVCVGSRNEGTLPGLLLGSVARAVVGRAACPVLVVSLRHLARVRGRRGVVVGIDGEPGSEALGAVAAAAAEARDTDLLAVHTWAHPHDPLLHPADVQLREEARLDELLDASVPGGAPNVRRLVEPGAPAEALVAASLTAELLVVGRHPRHGLHLDRLGAVTTAVLHRAACPVLVVPLVTAATARP